MVPAAKQAAKAAAPSARIGRKKAVSDYVCGFCGCSYSEAGLSRVWPESGHVLWYGCKCKLSCKHVQVVQGVCEDDTPEPQVFELCTTVYENP